MTKLYVKSCDMTKEVRFSEGAEIKGTLVHYWQDYKLTQPLWEMTWEVFRALRKNYYMLQYPRWSCRSNEQKLI